MAGMTLTGLAGNLTALALELEMRKHEALEAGAEIIEKEAKRVIGTYDYGWTELADATKKDRTDKGFSENDPLLRTGEMRESIGHAVHGDTASVGSNDDKAVWQELGTSRIPARSFLMGAAVHKEKEVVDAIGEIVVGHFSPARMIP